MIPKIVLITSMQEIKYSLDTETSDAASYCTCRGLVVTWAQFNRSTFKATRSVVLCLVSLMGNDIAGLCLSPLTRMCSVSRQPGFDVSVGAMKILLAQ